jgi:hypothetical protein
MSVEEDKGEILPPGIDVADRDSVPKPISDAPIPRKGPLPKDFQEALDILFDGDKPKPVVEPKPAPPSIEKPPMGPTVDHDAPQMIMPETMYQYPPSFAANFQRYGENNQPLDSIGQSQVPPTQEPKSIADEPEIHEEKSMDTQDEDEDTNPQEDKSSDSNDSTTAVDALPKKVIPEDNEETRRKRQELEDLAMLGIDADDLAAQCF